MDCPILTIRFLRPAAFRFFWIKYVWGFEPSHHCGKCLVGAYSKLLPYRGIQNLVRRPLNEHAEPFIYICGVTAHYESNVHVAGRFERGILTEYSDRHVEIHVENFRRVEIVAEKLPPAPLEYSACRNWQFGWLAFPNTKLQGKLL